MLGVVEELSRSHVVRFAKTTNFVDLFMKSKGREDSSTPSHHGCIEGCTSSRGYSCTSGCNDGCKRTGSPFIFQISIRMLVHVDVEFSVDSTEG